MRELSEYLKLNGTVWEREVIDRLILECTNTSTHLLRNFFEATKAQLTSERDVALEYSHNSGRAAFEQEILDKNLSTLPEITNILN